MEWEHPTHSKDISDQINLMADNGEKQDTTEDVSETEIGTKAKSDHYQKSLMVTKLLLFHHGDSELSKSNTRLQNKIDWIEYEKRVTNYENQGMTRSDAQGIVDMEMKNEQNTITDTRLNQQDYLTILDVLNMFCADDVPDFCTGMKTSEFTEQVGNTFRKILKICETNNQTTPA